MWNSSDRNKDKWSIEIKPAWRKAPWRLVHISRSAPHLSIRRAVHYIVSGNALAQLIILLRQITTVSVFTELTFTK